MIDPCLHNKSQYLIFSDINRDVGCFLPAQLYILKTTTMTWFQKTFKLKTRSKGCYLVTDEVLANIPELKDYKIGMINLFLQHTSAGLTLNENWDSDVRADMSDALGRIAPEGDMYRHDCEGSDDMPAHIRSSCK